MPPTGVVGVRAGGCALRGVGTARSGAVGVDRAVLAGGALRGRGVLAGGVLDCGNILTGGGVLGIRRGL